MPTTIGSPQLTLEEFRCRYADTDEKYEYWFGEAVPRYVGTWMHTLLQRILTELFIRAGYQAGPELELRIDPNWQPKPDVAAASFIEHPYPTRPIEVVAEILSPEDRMGRMFEKCRNYRRIGIEKIFVIDPESRHAWEWNDNTANLETVSVLALPNEQRIEVAEIWKDLDQTFS